LIFFPSYILDRASNIYFGVFFKATRLLGAGSESEEREQQFSKISGSGSRSVFYIIHKKYIF
jgi:hypothetical protein